MSEDLTGANVYRYWQKAHKIPGSPDQDALWRNDPELCALLVPTIGGPANSYHPQPGLWLINLSRAYIDGKKQPKSLVPMQIWLQDAEGTVYSKWQPGLLLGGKIDEEVVTSEQLNDRWIGCKHLKKADRDFYVANNKRWPWDAPASAVVDAIGKPKDVPVREQTAQQPAESAAVIPNGNIGAPGHNSGDPEGYEAMRAQIMGEIFEAQQWLKKPLVVKADADRAENWRKQIAGLGAAALESKRKEKRPLEDQLAVIENKWAGVINSAKEQALALKAAADRWLDAENKRLRDEALAKARAEHEAAEKVRKEKAEAARKAAEEAEAARQRMQEDDPVAFFTGSAPPPVEMPEPEPELKFDPVITVPKVLIGTQGNRRSAAAPKETAMIVDLSAAAAYYAGQNHPDLVALIQKLADKAAKSRASVPGIRMSWQTSEEKVS